MSERKRYRPAHLALFVPNLCQGGVGRVICDLAAELSCRGHRVDLVLCEAAGPYLEEFPERVRIVELPRSAWFPLQALASAPMDAPALVSYFLLRRAALLTLPHLPALIRYLRRDRPAVMLAAKTPANLAALWAARSAGVSTRIAISECTTLPSEFAKDRAWRLLAGPIRRHYRRADAQLAISNGVADAMAQCARLPRKQVITIYNGVVNAKLLSQAEEPIGHAWFQPNSPPVILGAGRLMPQKNFALLLRAFARVRKQRPVRLVILGEGPQRASLEALARKLGIAADMAMLGWVRNPAAYMARSAVFALASAWEGFGNVIVQALAAGCPVVSTDCPGGGPAEILDQGAYGRLAPAGDTAALAAALIAAVDESPFERRAERQRRASLFSTKRAADRYLEALLGEGAAPNPAPSP